MRKSGEAIRDVAGLRLAQLSSACREALELAAVIGRELDASLVARAISRFVPALPIREAMKKITWTDPPNWKLQ